MLQHSDRVSVSLSKLSNKSGNDKCEARLTTAKRPIYLYLIFEKSSLKNQVRQTGFLTCKIQFQNYFLQATQAVKIQFEID